MAMLADSVEVVIGVDTHKHTHTAAVVAAATGAGVSQATVPATSSGYQQLLEFATRQPAGESGRSRGPVATGPG